MRSAALWMMITAALILAYIWPEGKFYMPKPEPWPTASGTIVSSEVRTVETDDAEQFKAAILYRYRIDENSPEREGSRVLPAEPIFSAREEAERLIKAFPVGKQVKVYVNPVEKSEPPAVLVWEFPDVISPVVIIIIVLFATSVVLYILSEYQKFKK